MKENFDFDFEYYDGKYVYEQNFTHPNHIHTYYSTISAEFIEKIIGLCEYDYEKEILKQFIIKTYGPRSIEFPFHINNTKLFYNEFIKHINYVNTLLSINSNSFYELIFEDR